jgi:Ca2+-binding RTX toxin-like protein
VVDGDVGDSDQIRIDMDADTNISLANWVFTEWTETGPDNDRVRIFGDADNENIVGSTVRDDIVGGDGTNSLNGHLGRDFLSGGSPAGGIDRFVFDTTLGPDNFDRVSDFEIDIDELRIENTIFTGVGAAGNLAANRFHTGNVATDADHRIIYNDVSGAVFFDEDGVGGVDQVRFAILDAGLALDNLDIRVT